MALYTYDGPARVFPGVRLANGRQLVAEPGGTYDLAEETDDPRFTSAGSVPTPPDSSISGNPATTGFTPEPAVSPESPETGPDGPESDSETIPEHKERLSTPRPI